MAIVPIQTTAITQTTGTHEAVSKGLSDMVQQNAPSNADVDTFSSALAQAQNPAAPLSAAQQSNLGQYVGDIMGNMVDRIATTKKKIENFGTDADSLSPAGMLKFQKVVEENAITTQVFAKVVSTAAKQIESLTHIQ